MGLRLAGLCLVVTVALGVTLESGKHHIVKQHAMPHEVELEETQNMNSAMCSLISDVKSIGVLGKGGFGTVFGGRFDHGGIDIEYPYVVKELVNKIAFEEEVKVLGKIPTWTNGKFLDLRAACPMGTKHLLNPTAVCVDDGANPPTKLDMPVVIYPNGGKSLNDIWEANIMPLLSQKGSYLSDYPRVDMCTAMSVLHQVAIALQCLHDLGISHCDVKPENIVVSKTGDVTLIDIGTLAVVEKDDLSGENARCLGFTRAYSDLHTGKEANFLDGGPQSDVFALGASIFKLITGTRPNTWELPLRGGVDYGLMEYARSFDFGKPVNWLTSLGVNLLPGGPLSEIQSFQQFKNAVEAGVFSARKPKDMQINPYGYSKKDAKTTTNLMKKMLKKDRKKRITAESLVKETEHIIKESCYVGMAPYLPIGEAAKIYAMKLGR